MPVRARSTRIGFFLACACLAFAVTVSSVCAEAPALNVSKERLPLGASRTPAAKPGAPAGKATTGPATDIWQTAAALGAVIVLIVTAGAVYRVLTGKKIGLAAAIGRRGRSPAGVLQVLGRFPVARGQTLILLKMDQRILLLAQAGGGRFGKGASLSTLCEVTDPDEAASLVALVAEHDDRAPGRFRAALSSRRWRTPAEAGVTAIRDQAPMARGDEPRPFGMAVDSLRDRLSRMRAESGA